jgi:hypothetical protein
MIVDQNQINITVALHARTTIGTSLRAEVTATAHRFPTADLPAITLKALLVPGERTSEGVLIEAVAVPWFDILDRFHRDPPSIYEIDPRTWEEIIAGAYTRE